MEIEIWSDVVCPWCAIGKRRFESALGRFPHREQVAVRWRSFELDPEAPGERREGLTAHLAAKYGMSTEDARGMQERMTAVAAGEGLSFDFPRARPASTFDAHRLLHLAGARGVQDALKERLLAAYLERGLLVSDHDVLADVAEDAGLDPAETREVLASDAYADAVRADEATARSLGITGVPFFVIDRAYGVSGAQSPEVLLRALEQAWAASHPLTVVGATGADADGACADGSCAI